MSKKDMSEVASKVNTRLVKKDKEGNIIGMIEREYKKNDKGEMEENEVRELSAEDAKKKLKEIELKKSKFNK